MVSLFYAGMGQNKHAESAYLKKKQENKKEMRKYKVSVLREKVHETVGMARAFNLTFAYGFYQLVANQHHCFQGSLFLWLYSISN